VRQLTVAIYCRHRIGDFNLPAAYPDGMDFGSPSGPVDWLQAGQPGFLFGHHPWRIGALAPQLGALQRQ
jgi:hypothetical protein